MRNVTGLLAVIAMLAGIPVLAQEKPSVLKVGDPMPEFTLRNGLTGKDVTFSGDIKGTTEVIAIAFFNTGCSACMAEIDEMSKASRELGEAKVKVFGIAVDKRGEQSVKAYNEIYNFQVTYLLDPTFSMPPKFGFSYTPSCLLLNKEGVIAFLKGGFDPVRDGGLIVKEINKILKPE